MKQNPTHRLFQLKILVVGRIPFCRCDTPFNDISRLLSSQCWAQSVILHRDNLFILLLLRKVYASVQKSQTCVEMRRLAFVLSASIATIEYSRAKSFHHALRNLYNVRSALLVFISIWWWMPQRRTLNHSFAFVSFR